MNKLTNKFRQALTLPTLCNINPRSLYNKKNEFTTFIEQENIDVAFISETWETENETLEDITGSSSRWGFSTKTQR